VEMCLARPAREADGFIFPLKLAAQHYATTWTARRE
jgi:hypothetical protein